jgi:small GTP-binding protein
MTVLKTAKMTRVPATLLEIRRMFDALDWVEMSRQVEEETLAQVAIVGPVNSGKSTLFNTLKGREISPVAAVPGTTRDLHYEQWGPFTLTDTPGFGEVDGVDRAGIALQGIRAANVIVLVLDAVSGVRHTDYALLQQLKITGKPVVVVLNKIDLLKADRDAVITDARDKLGEPDLLPISAKRGTNIARLVPRIIDSHTSLAVALGRALPAYRRQAANKIVRNATLLNAVIGAEPMSAQHAKELIATIAGGLALRFLAQEAAKLLPGPGWVIAGAIAAFGTWAIGQVAVQYFEHGKKLNAMQLRNQYKQHLVSRRQLTA